LRATDALLAYFPHLICVRTTLEPALFTDNNFRRDYEPTENFSIA
jgi:hypothetical protein